MASSQQVLLLVISALTELCTEGGPVSEKVAPFLARGLANLDPGRPASYLVRFAYHFCFVGAHKVYADLIDSFVDVFKRMRAFLEGFMKRTFKNYLDHETVNEQPVKDYVDAFLNASKDLLERCLEMSDSMENVEWIVDLMGRISQALEGETRLRLSWKNWADLRELCRVLSSKHLADAVRVWEKSAAWGPVFELMKENMECEGIDTVVGKVPRKIPKEMLLPIWEWADEPTAICACFAELRQRVEYALRSYLKKGKMEAEEAMPFWALWE
jgi:hypothetical protein